MSAPPAYMYEFKRDDRHWDTESDDGSLHDGHHHGHHHKPSGCQVLGWVVVGILTIYILGYLFVWLTGMDQAGCGTGTSSKVAALAPPAGPTRIKNDGELHHCAKKNATTVVMFHAPWCSHCKQALPQFEIASKQAGVECYTADCQNDVQAYTDYNIKGFPTFLRFDAAGDFVEYTGKRDAASLLQFINGK